MVLIVLRYRAKQHVNFWLGLQYPLNAAENNKIQGNSKKSYHHSSFFKLRGRQPQDFPVHSAFGSALW